ncbi:MAG: flagellar type III secretion system pore protein FliP [Vampirovibrio sp.]
MKQRILWCALWIGVLGAMYLPQADASGVALPTLQLGVSNASSPEQVAQGVQVLILLTVLTLAPSILVMTTAFTRIVIVLSLVRQAIGTPSLPPSQVIVSLAMILSFFVMAPTFEEVNQVAFQPFMKGRISVDVALEKAMEPMRLFMFKQTSEKDIALFTKLAKIKKPKTTKDVPTYVLLPSFIISELKTAFQLGFVLFLPFIVIDIVVSSILVSMGMMFLPPATISLPFKLILFVLVDGWHLIAQSLVLGFR